MRRGGIRPAAGPAPPPPPPPPPPPGAVAPRAPPTAAVSTVAGFVRPVRPDRVPRELLALRRYGATPAGVAASAAELYPNRAAVIDELGSVTFGELDHQAAGLAAELHGRFGL